MTQTASAPVAVIMAGGTGTRFWPLSTEALPKQFIKLFGDRSLLQKSFDRVRDIIAPDRILVLTNRIYIDLVAEQLPEIPPENIVGEPMRRDTAAAVCLAALLARKRFGDPVIITLTSDHLIEPVSLFQKTLMSAARMAVRTGALYTFGIRPAYAATAYGYLEIEDPEDGLDHYKVKRFKEKPDATTAAAYVKAGRFLWNSGMFVWTAGAIIGQMEAHLPDHIRHLSPAVAAHGGAEWITALETAFAALSPISIDYGVMEKAADVRCVAAAFSWSDVGGWLAMEQYLEADGDGNRCKGRLYALETRNNIVFCDDPEETLALVGVEDLVVVRAGNRTLIARKSRAEDVKKVVERLSKGAER